MKPRKPSAAPPNRRLVGDREGAPYIGLSRSQFRELVAAQVIPRVQVPDGNGGTLRRLLVDLNDLDKLIQNWKQRQPTKEDRDD